MKTMMALWWLALACVGQAYQVLISDESDTRQVCSGMYGSGGTRDPWIDVVFAPSSAGSLALVIYEWEDARFLGVDSDGGGQGDNQWEEDRIYVCTQAALRANLCEEADLGKFIVSTPIEISPTSTSIFTTAVRFPSTASEESTINDGPFRYAVNKTGYYCVGAVPLSTEIAEAATSNSTIDATYTGVVDFENTFLGHLPAAEYPKIWFYFLLSVIYVLFGIGWGVLCVKNKADISPLQHYVSCTIGLLVIEMLSIYAYYNYLNSHGSRGLSQFLLVVVSILNAARNSISFFLLCIVCMGYGVVRPSLGPQMIRVKILAGLHAVFGIIYSIGTVTVPLESAGYFILLMVFPLAFTLTSFMMWIMISLNATILDLSNRKQTYKKNMFVKLYRILLLAVVVIAAFFVISTISFSNRLDEDYAPGTWKTRWWLLDGWLSILYLVVFFSIAWVWRPSPNNRLLAMSEELAQDDHNEFEIDDLEGGKDDEDDRQGFSRVGADEVVFDIGEEGSDDESPRDHSKAKHSDGSDDEGVALTGRRESEDGPPVYSK